MAASKPLTRSALVTPLAIARVEYERYVARLGHGPAAYQPLPAWCSGEVKAMLKRGERVTGCTYTEGTYGPLYTLNVDWVALAARVERALPTWRETYERVEGPVEVLS